MRTVSVALPLPIRRSFTYRVPDTLAVPLPGTRVRVPFGERVLTGIVVPGAPVARAEPREVVLRDVLEVLDEEPVCPPELLETAAKVAQRFFAAPGEVFKSVLPARLPAAGSVRYRITEKGALAATRAPREERPLLEALADGRSARIAELPPEARPPRDVLRSLEQRGWIRAVSAERRAGRRPVIAYLPGRLDRAERDALLRRSRSGRAAADWLDALGRPATAAEIRAATGAGPSVLRTLAAKGVLSTFEQTDRSGEREFPSPFGTPAADFVLTPEQSGALETILSAIRERRYLPALLQGVTGSGKTEIYLRAIAATLDLGRGAVWLVPEIALTPVFARELRRQFADRAAVLHSALSEGERARAWDRVRSGEARVVIGPRSAAFAPIADPGLFVVDEEHDSSYKQRESPRYDAREVAAIRAKANAAALVMGSATPSMETYHAARVGRMALGKLTSRVESRPLPAVEIVDLRREKALPEEKGVPLFSAPLVERLRAVFARGEQAILLQPRRGFAPYLLCRDCGFDFRCTNCSVSRTVHERGRRLVCHYCGERRPRPERCPECGGALLEAIGAGTERVADRFAELFPDVPWTILDRDSARRRGVEAVVDDVLSGRALCLIGTQMVAKGHDFPNVTAVGVLSADSILNFPDFRSAEKTFQLLAQVSGRAGRGAEPGTVHVQTFHPGHPAIRQASVHDVDGFAAQELEFRRSFFYPPFSELASVIVSAADREKAESAAAELGRALSAAASGKNVRLSGPAPAPLERLQGKWRFQVLIRAPDRGAVLRVLEEAIPEQPPGGTQIATDVDPQDLM
ncbi:MAG TPA: primosomal protein N' [Thermoanaerobaculia bacterium]|nr:primosomal protein N' [Thermoanaerobaculia bacterium]